MAICPIIVHFSTWRARSMHDVAWRGMWICVRSKDAQKQLARTSLRTFARNFSNIDFFLKILPLKDDQLAMSEM